MFSDVAFYPANFLSDFIMVGMSGSFLRYSREDRLWHLVQQGTGIHGTSDASATSLLMGKDICQVTYSMAPAMLQPPACSWVRIYARLPIPWHQQCFSLQPAHG